MASPVDVDRLFGWGGKAGADDTVASSAFDVDDVEEPRPWRETDGCKSFVGGGAGIEVRGMRILKGGGCFEERDPVLFEARGGLVGVPFVVAEHDRGHVNSMCLNTCFVKVSGDESTDLPEGTKVELLAVDDAFSPEERARLLRAIDDGIEDFERGDHMDGFEFIAQMRAGREAAGR